MDDRSFALDLPEDAEQARTEQVLPGAKAAAVTGMYISHWDSGRRRGGR